MRVNGSIPSLVQGVSQQPASLRLPTQAEEQLNAVSSLLDGLSKRPPTEHIAKIASQTYVKPYVHFVNRDAVEQYVMLFYPDHIVVADREGRQYPVVEQVTGISFAYLQSQRPYRNFKALTINDTTFLTNRGVSVKILAETIPERGFEALVYIRTGSYGTTYTVKVGTFTATYTTSTTDVLTLQTTNIAEQLRGTLATGLGANYSVVRFANTIWIKRVDDLSFIITSNDDNGGNNHVLVVNEVGNFSDLPDSAPNGMVIKVRGSIVDKEDDYWVKFQTKQGQSIGPGFWLETAKPGIKFRLSDATMPHTLTRKQDDADGTVTSIADAIYFEFGRPEWKVRGSGDGISSPTPSFVGNMINDIFLYRGRLGFLAQSNVIMSQAGDLLNFFRQTATTLLDDDPIDVAVAYEEPLNLRHSIGFNNELLLFSDRAQFTLKGGEILSPKTVSVMVASKYTAHIECVPANLENSVYFPYDFGEFTGIREYFVDGNTNEKKAKSVTEHAPRYIKGSALRLVVSPTDDLLFVMTEQDRNSMWVYKWFWQGTDKVQSSWSKWTFGEDATIIGVGFLGSDLYMVIVYPQGTFLEQIRLNPGAVDAPSDFLIHLDRRFSEDNAARIEYDELSNTTIVHAPYPLNGSDGPYMVVTRGNGDDVPPGRSYHVEEVTFQYIKVAGDARAGFWAGRMYSMEYEFSPLYLRRQSLAGVLTTVTEGRLQVLDMTVKYDRTGYLRAEVIPDHNDPAVYLMTGQIVLVPKVGTGLGTPQVRTGEFKFPVMARNTQVRIRITNDSPLPSHIASAEWIGLYSSKAKAI